MANIVAIVGRPNVGKSTLFNRLTEVKKAIVDETSGVTRDRHYGKCEWNGRIFTLIDTGGYVTNSDDVFEAEIRKQVALAIEEAGIILFMVDVNTGITDLDVAVAEILRKSGKKTLLVANKVDNYNKIYEAQEFYGLGMDKLYCISSVNGSGTGEMLDAIVENLPGQENLTGEEDKLPKLAVVGRPNVGKSSLINSLIGEERNIVTPISGTTRDSIFVRYQKYNHDFLLVDTAGLRKKGKVRENLEFYSVLRSVRTIENADVCLLMIDATLGVESQDLNIFHLIQRNHKGIVVLINKWDIIEKETDTAKHYKEAVKTRVAPFNDVPIIFTSAISRQRIHKVLETAIEVHENRKQKIPTSELNEVMLKAIENYPPPAYKGKYVKVKYVVQLPTYSPSFAFYCNYPQYMKEPYKRYVENQLRKHFNFTGVPIRVFFRRK